MVIVAIEKMKLITILIQTPKFLDLMEINPKVSWIKANIAKLQAFTPETSGSVIALYSCGAKAKGLINMIKLVTSSKYFQLVTL